MAVWMTSWLLLCAAAAGAAPLPLPPPEPARGVLVAPVQATWAANHAAHWQRLGVDGFALHGIFDTFADNPWARDGRPHTIGGDDLLLKEVALAHRRLSEDGITENFLYFPMRPEAPWFAVPGDARALVRGFEDAAVFCHEAGLRGLVVDTGSSARVFQPGWDGYPAESRDPEALARAAHDTGRRALRAIAAACPEIDLLFLADAVPEAGPLWFPFIAGVLDGLGAADTIGVHVLVRESLYETRPAVLHTLAERTRRMVRQRLSPAAQARWDRFGGVGLGLRPLGYNDAGDPVRYYTLEDFRVQVAAAKAFSTRYFWVEAPLQSWWQVAPDEAEQYTALFQNGGAVPAQTRPAAANLAEYAWRAPFDGMRRVGPLDSEAGVAMVFRHKEGAAALFWEAGPGPIAGAGEDARVLDVRRGVEIAVAPGGAGGVKLPDGDGFWFVSPLPDHLWSLPAALWLTTADPLTPLRRRTTLRFGFRNPLPHAVHGTLQVAAPPAFGIGRAGETLTVAPGGNSALERALQGVFAPGTGYPFTISLAVPEAPRPENRSARRTVPVPVLPPLEWEAFLDGPPLAAPVQAPAEEGPPELLVTTGGSVSLWSMNGERRWVYALDRTPAASAVPLRGRLGGGRIAVLSHAGELLLLDLDGRPAARVATDMTARPGVLVSAALFDSPGGVLLAADIEGHVHALASNGAKIWQSEAVGDIRHILAPQSAGTESPPLFVTAGPRLYALARDGEVLWEAATVGPASCPPVLLAGPEPAVWVATVHGIVHRFDPATGTEHGRTSLPVEEPVRAMLPLPAPGGGTPAVLVAGNQAVRACDMDGETLWEARAPAVSAVSMAYAGGAWAILAAAGDGLHAFSPGGAHLWHDGRAAAPLTGAPVVAVMGKQGLVTAVYAAGDHALRAIDLGPAAAPRVVEVPAETEGEETEDEGEGQETEEEGEEQAGE